MAWFECTGGSNHVEENKYWVLNPDVSDVMGSFSPTQNARYFFPYVCKIHNNATRNMVTSENITFDGSSKACVYRDGYEIGCFFYGLKIPKHKYQKLYVECQVTASGTGWKQAHIVLTRDMSYTSDAVPSNTIKDIALVDDSMTASQINSQTGVIINSTDSTLLSAQTVEVDVSGIEEDFYIAFWNCDRRLALRRIYLE